MGAAEKAGLDEAEPWLDEAEPSRGSSKVIFHLQRALHQRDRLLVQNLSSRGQAGEVATSARLPPAL